MFDWCQKVEVYNIETHFHFYIENKQPNFSRPHANIPKFKAGTIQVSTQKKTKSKTLPNAKKGLSLSRRIQTEGNSPGLGSFTLKPVSSNKIGYDQSTQNPISRHRPQSVTMRTEQSEQQAKGSQRMLKGVTYLDMIKGDRGRKSTINIQKIGLTPQPIINPKTSNIQIYDVPPLKLKNLSSTMEDTHFSLNHNIHTLSRDQIRQKLDIKEVVTSTNLNSLINLSKRNSKTHLQSQQVSPTSSLIIKKPQSSQEPEGKNQASHNFELRPRNPLKEASVILSQILSRNSTSQILNQQNCVSCTKPTNRNFLEVTHLWNEHDTYTIVSRQNEDQQQKSARIEESILYERQFRHNFHSIEEGRFETDQYSLRLGIEVEIRCIVSLKEIAISNMNLIAAELNAYNVVENSGMLEEASKNILELYQVQMSENSYLLIKQPYTANLIDYFMDLSHEKQEETIRTLKQNVKGILRFFSSQKLYPCRVLTLQDFVECSEVLKLHDLSAFKHMDEPQYDVGQILDNLDVCLTLEYY